MSRYFNPVKLNFIDDFKDIGIVLKPYGKRCLLVIQDNFDIMIDLRNQFTCLMQDMDISVEVFNDIRANPLSTDIDKGIDTVKNNKFDFIVAFGGGSTLDSAKVLAFSNEYDVVWEKMYNRSNIKRNPLKLPLIAIPTTAGTGSHVTQASVVSDVRNVKHTIFSDDFFPTEAIVLPKLTMTLPSILTASTGFDAFCHLSESYINKRYSDLSHLITKEGMNKIIEFLPKVIRENKIEYRYALAVADTYAGLALSNGGANVPHTFGECITSGAQKVNHGQSLAIIYPYFVKHFFYHDLYSKGIKEVLGLLNDGIQPTNPINAVRIICDFLDEINLSYKLSSYDLSKDEFEVMIRLFHQQTKFNDECIVDFINDIVNENVQF